MPVPGITVEAIVKDHEELKLTLITGEEGVGNRINNSEINRPGLSLTGFLTFLQTIGSRFLERVSGLISNSLSEQSLKEITEKFFEFHLNCIIYTHGNEPQFHL